MRVTPAPSASKAVSSERALEPPSISTATSAPAASVHSRHLAESPETAGVPVEVREVPGADHAWHGTPDEQVEEIFLHSLGRAPRVVSSRGTHG
ncbi:hypothetical protein [Streptomyces spinosirectus]